MEAKFLPNMVFSKVWSKYKYKIYYFLSLENNFRNLRAKPALGQYSRLSRHTKQQQRSHPPAMGNYYMQVPVSMLGDRGTAGIDSSRHGEAVPHLSNASTPRALFTTRKKPTLQWREVK